MVAKMLIRDLMLVIQHVAQKVQYTRLVIAGQMLMPMLMAAIIIPNAAPVHIQIQIQEPGPTRTRIAIAGPIPDLIIHRVILRLRPIGPTTMPVHQAIVVLAAQVLQAIVVQAVRIVIVVQVHLTQEVPDPRAPIARLAHQVPRVPIVHQVLLAVHALLDLLDLQDRVHHPVPAAEGNRIS